MKKPTLDARRVSGSRTLLLLMHLDFSCPEANSSFAIFALGEPLTTAPNNSTVQNS